MASERRTPTLVRSYEGEPPERTRDGFWKTQFETVLKPNPGVIQVYGNVSPSAASNLRREYGLDAYTVTTNGEPEVHVRYLPDEVERIKRETRERGAKRMATIAENKAKKTATGARKAS